jgi:hypothetical protein
LRFGRAMPTVSHTPLPTASICSDYFKELVLDTHSRVATDIPVLHKLPRERRKIEERLTLNGSTIRAYLPF